ncbi:ABC transporter ATP-binding protein [Variovorax sp. 770b2]|uniref:ABC transporter ATP-binding protein n=1 Tax=Variovorax sp. 770b2 TaxID=1566271 RepID=UPI0008E4E337|nr:ABC transporter ATP-binding protein [Variovorax sp. 770b2]SFQ33363.1 branched-chain amino acid transport system ATP-binding protein [Variovorax sp. 770b2]
MNETTTVLAVERLSAGYGGNQVLDGVSFDLRRGEVVTLLGRNGAGKSTTLKCLMGFITEKTGTIDFEGTPIARCLPEQIARLGMAYCPEERGIFSQLNVRENLTLPPVIREGGLTLDEVYALFPNLRERGASQGTKLSGGEQQMLAIGRILRSGAKCLLLDEPSEGLAPVIVKLIAKTVHELKRRGFTILLVEQNLRFATELADRHYVMETGRVVDMLTRDDMRHGNDRVEAYLGI